MFTSQYDEPSYPPRKAMNNYILLLIPTKLIILTKNHPHKCHPFLHNSYNHFLSLQYKNNPPCHQIYLRNVLFPLMQPEEEANQSKNGSALKIDIFDSK